MVEVAVRQYLKEMAPFSLDRESFVLDEPSKVLAREEMDVADVVRLVKGLVIGKACEDRQCEAIHRSRDVRRGEKGPPGCLQDPTDLPQETKRVPHVLDDFCGDHGIE